MNSLADILSSKTDDFLNQGTRSKEQGTINSAVPQGFSLDKTAPNTTKLDPKQLQSMLYGLRDQIDNLIRLVSGQTLSFPIKQNSEALILAGGEQVIEGVFNGEKMVGPDGKEYSVPPNYASKSKLVEGDMMKLTITNQGRFIYKQIAPIERKRIIGELTEDSTTGQWQVVAEGKPYKVLTASVTFYRGKSGDQAVILVPESGESSWGAVENIVASSKF